MTTLTSPSLSSTLSSLRFDWLMALLGVWLIGGLYLDGWAHNHNPDLETFFTPWHGVLYSGFLIQAAVLAGVFVNQWRHGKPLTQTLPPGYGLSLIGAGLFTIGGVADMLWHIRFGIEIGVEALLSPTHLILAMGGSLLISGPLRAAFQRAAGSWPDSLPMIISTVTLYCILTFFSVYANPFANTWVTTFDRPANGYNYITQAIGIISYLFQSALLSAVLLIILRNNQLHPGHLTLMLAVNAGATVLINDIFLSANPLWLFVVGLIAGLLADGLLWLLKPSIANLRGLRLFSAAVPALLYSSYFIALILTTGLWWSIHLWTGAIFLAGAMGWLVSYLVIPSAYEKVSVTPS